MWWVNENSYEGEMKTKINKIRKCMICKSVLNDIHRKYDLCRKHSRMFYNWIKVQKDRL